VLLIFGFVVEEVGDTIKIAIIENISLSEKKSSLLFHVMVVYILYHALTHIFLDT